MALYYDKNLHPDLHYKLVLSQLLLFDRLFWGFFPSAGQFYCKITSFQQWLRKGDVAVVVAGDL